MATASTPLAALVLGCIAALCARCDALAEGIGIDTAKRYANQGIMAQYEGRLTTAADHFRTAIKHDATNNIAHQHLAHCLQKQGDLLSAISHLNTALAHTGESEHGRTEMLFNLGDVYEEMGYVSDAQRVFSDLLQSDESLLKAKTNLANVLLDGCGERTQALQMYRDVCSSNSGEGGTANARWMCGIAADSEGFHDEARKMYESALALTPDDDDARLHMVVSAARRGDSECEAQLMSTLPPYIASSWEYVRDTPVAFAPPIHFFTFDMIALGLEHVTLSNGLHLEFGVFHGKTIRMAASATPDATIHGFDTFSGIPEQWHLEAAGSYSTHGHLPPAPSNVEYHVGLFSETLPAFLEAHEGPIAFMNIDCDLYSSTKDIFDGLHPRVVPGTVIVFDEYVMNSCWQQDEFKAFKEAVETYGWQFEYLGISLVSKQSVVKIV